MRVKILLCILMAFPLFAHSMNISEQKVGDKIYAKIKGINAENFVKINFLKKVKNDSKYQKYGEVFDYVILKIKLEDSNFCNDYKYCSGLDSCMEAKIRLNYCGHKSLDKDNDSVPCENLCN